VGSSVTTSDAAGHFAMTVPEADSYLVDIYKMGYAEYSRPIRRPAHGQRFTLNKASAFPNFNPAIDNTLVDNRPQWLNPCGPTASCPRLPGKVTIPANSLNLSPPPVGPLTAYLATYDPTTESIPGDQTAINPAGQQV